MGLLDAMCLIWRLPRGSFDIALDKASEVGYKARGSFASSSFLIVSWLVAQTVALPKHVGHRKENEPGLGVL